jgi:hypothetical protein
MYVFYYFFKEKWQEVQGMTKKKEAARSANAHATGGGPPLVCNLRHFKIYEKLRNSQIAEKSFFI